MNDEKKSGKQKWIKPDVVVINVKEYEKAIIANANSMCGGGGGGMNCGWNVICAMSM